MGMTQSLVATITTDGAKNKESSKSKKKMKKTIKPNRLSRSNLPRDNLFDICNYLDSFSKAHLRFTSMTTHIDMMGCPLNVIKINISSSSLKFAKSYAPLTIVNCDDASRQLPPIHFETAEVNQTLCNDFTESQLSSLGIGRSWSIDKTAVTYGDTADDVTEMCDILRHNAFRSLKRLKFWPSTDKNEDIISNLSTRNVAEYVEDLCIRGATQCNSLDDISLHSFKMLRRVVLDNVSIGLEDFVKYSPQIEELILNEIVTFENISCLAELKNLKTLLIKVKPSVCLSSRYHGDIVSLSSCTKLTYLSINSENVTGNISSLITLTNLEVLKLYNTKLEGNIESLLKYLPKLKSLYLTSNSNLTGNLVFTGNIELEWLYVCDNNMHLELSSLTHLKKLKEIAIIYMPYVKGDISAMSGLTKLFTLEINDCQVTGSISSLAELPNLNFLCLTSLSNITGDASLFPHIVDVLIEGCNEVNVTR